MKNQFPTGTKAGFTLVELLVSMAIMLLLMMILVSITNATRKTWTYTTGKVEEFREAREAFESLTRRISQATLNTYWDYVDANGNARTSANASTFVPAKYARQSELRFISAPALTGNANGPSHAIFFQAPLGFTDDASGSYQGLETLLNTWGFYIQFGDDSALPACVSNLYGASRHRCRFRLMEMMEPSQSLTLYTKTSGSSSYVGQEWFTTPLNSSTVPKRALAENIVALIILPKLTPNDQLAGNPTLGINQYDDTSLAPAYLYDSTATKADNYLNSKNQLPPVVQVTMVAVDETSFNRFQKDSTDLPTALFGSSTFTNAQNYATELQQLQTNLQTYKINYRVFTTNVSIKGAKWSRVQTN